MEEIVYFDRYQNRKCREQVYGDNFLKWTYGTVPGRIALNTVVKRALFSRWYGWRMNRPASQKKIDPFIREFDLDADEFELLPGEFATFNEFFYRKLKRQARPIDQQEDSLVFPADGRHLCIPDLSQSNGMFVKGETLDLAALVADDELTQRYENGSLLLSRLCPVDYHRFHFPASGTPGAARLINGPLYSVNPIALCQNIQILATNKRVLTKLETDRAGTVLVIEVGATCVGSICQTYVENRRVSKGDEKGYFRFGGSSTIVIFEPGRIQFDQDLIEYSRQHCELYARVGDHFATIT